MTPSQKPAVKTRDHGGGLDVAIARFGGNRNSWLDLSTGINPVPYPVPDLPQDAWSALPDIAAHNRLIEAARAFWQVPKNAQIIPAAGASAIIARVPSLCGPGKFTISEPTYNEHKAAFVAAGWTMAPAGEARIWVHPNNPDGRLTDIDKIRKAHHKLTVIDESFCDVCPEKSMVELGATPGFIILKSFGKFWGLAGLRLGFAICAKETAEKLTKTLGPWAVSGPAQNIGAIALADQDWAAHTRARLGCDALRLDDLVCNFGGLVVGGTDLFRLYDFKDAARVQTQLATRHIWSRVFPYSQHWLRLGLPGDKAGWSRLEQAIGALA